MAGRKSKYTPELVDKLIQAISLGAIDADACAYAGISHTTFYLWQNTKPEFAERVTRARPAGHIADLQVIAKAARDGDWRAAAEHLDRTRSPYRKSTDVNLSGTVTHNHRDLSIFTNDEIDSLAAVAERVKAGMPS